LVIGIGDARGPLLGKPSDCLSATGAVIGKIAERPYERRIGGWGGTQLSHGRRGQQTNTFKGGHLIRRGVEADGVDLEQRLAGFAAPTHDRAGVTEGVRLAGEESIAGKTGGFAGDAGDVKGDGLGRA